MYAYLVCEGHGGRVVVDYPAVDYPSRLKGKFILFELVFKLFFYFITWGMGDPTMLHPSVTSTPGAAKTRSRGILRNMREIGKY